MKITGVNKYDYLSTIVIIHHSFILHIVCLFSADFNNNNNNLLFNNYIYIYTVKLCKLFKYI